MADSSSEDIATVDNSRAGTLELEVGSKDMAACMAWVGLEEERIVQEEASSVAMVVADNS